MKTKVIIALSFLLSTVSVQAQYSVSVNYGNVDWIPKSNKVLVYENMFILQSFTFAKAGISVWQASSITTSPNSYELAGLDYSRTFGKIKTRIGLHGYFPKETFTKYSNKGNVIPNIGISFIPNESQSLTANVYQYWNYSISSNFFVSNVVYKKNFTFGTIEMGQYYNFNIDALSGSVAYSKSWQIYKKLSGFASLRWSFNESKSKLNDGSFIIANIGIKI